MNRAQRRAGMVPTVQMPAGTNFRVETQIFHTEEHVVIGFNQKINNFKMTPDQVDSLIDGLKTVKAALLEHMTKAPKNV